MSRQHIVQKRETLQHVETNQMGTAGDMDEGVVTISAGLGSSGEETGLDVTRTQCTFSSAQDIEEDVSIVFHSASFALFIGGEFRPALGAIHVQAGPIM